MNIFQRWSRRVGVLLVILVAGLFTPAAASAHTTSAAFDASDTLAKGRALAVTGGLAAVCCLLVVAAVVLPIVLLIRRRRR